MKKNINILIKFIFILSCIAGTASASIIIDSPNDVIYAGTFNGSNIFADLIDASSLTIHSNIIISGTVDGRDISDDGLVLDDHISNVSNPHNVLASQLSDFNTEVNTILDTHTTNMSNPHTVTKEQIGLGNLTDDTQLTVSQLDTVLTDDITKVASSGAVIDYVDTTESNIIIYVNTVAVPTGSFIPFAGLTAPDGYLICDGSAIDRTTYAELFAVIGTYYGSGDGSTTFNIPNMQGNIAVGIGGSGVTSLGDTGGEQEHTLTIAEMPRHNHGNGISSGGADVGAYRYANLGSTGYAGGDAAHNNMQPYVGSNYIIKC